MSEQTPSQAEGERDDDQELRSGPSAGQRKPQHPDCPRTTPSQAEGERERDEEGTRRGRNRPGG
ncbi:MULTISPECIES: hypothetical protein [Streptomyces]|uniref:Uncharacterized protein n=1 Tax=Streptomyces cacaoi TaxID=1898 RepID=A0A4Y3R8K5_STRCI|nr:MULTISPECIES: hypothetical protein [Streptomyces]NNG84829.1 hypothetical protein [Streptomyces cacaoi]QHF96850.1 hypothetical protein DEH18_26750 [Streptomyces sp. NHF165]GEB53971.1 hypothetical protein SCA03_65220 [Streptomyces cacaoi]